MRSTHATLAVLVAATLGATALAARHGPPGDTGQPVTPALEATRRARGEYLVKVAACNDCHTPWKLGDSGPEPDMSRMLSGHPAALTMPPPPGMSPPWVASASATNTAWATPLGVAFAANLTPHASGLGGWTQQQFVFALRTGRHKGIGRPILPPMPNTLRLLTDEDLVSIFTYLRSIPPIDNVVPEAVLPSGPPAPEPPFDPKSMMAPPAPATDPVSRGRYLVDAIGCTDCHTPSRLGDRGPEPDPGRMFAGYPSSEKPPAARPAVGPWTMHLTASQAFAGPWGISFAANLTPDEETGLGSWTAQQFIDSLRNGRHQGRGRQLLPPMPWPAFGQMTDTDLQAVFAYLKTLPKVRNKVPDPVPPPAGGPGAP